MRCSVPGVGKAYVSSLGGLALVLGLAVTAAAATGWSAEPSSPGTAKAPEPPAYRPVTSDLMNAVIQPRHTKLWLASKNGDPFPDRTSRRRTAEDMRLGAVGRSRRPAR